MTVKARKCEILTVASALFAERGFDAVSVRDLARALQMTPAGLYHHFTDKEELYRETLVYVFSRIDPILDQTGNGKTTRDYLEQLVHSIICFLLQDTVFMHLLSRALVSDNVERSAFLVEKVLRPLYGKIVRELTAKEEPSTVQILADTFVISIIGSVHMARFFSCLHHDPSYASDPEAITACIMQILNRQVSEPGL